MTLDNDADYFLELQANTGWGRILKRFADWLNPPPGVKVLDVGCGPGLLPSLFAKKGCLTWGVDNDLAMFQPFSLYSDVVIGDVYQLPFRKMAFDLITASNLLFLIEDPLTALEGMAFFLAAEGRIALLNPTEKFTVRAAEALAEEKQLDGLARETLLNYAARAETHYRWNDEEQAALFHQVGLELVAKKEVMGRGFVRFTLAKRVNVS